MSRPYPLGWFSTGRDKAARDLLEVVEKNIRNGNIDAEISFVFCSREPGENPESDRFIELVSEYRIPLVCFSYEKFKSAHNSKTSQSDTLPEWRLEYDRRVMDKLKDYSPEICVLAGYMLIVGPEMCRRYNMINLHPAAPGGPTGTWQEVVWKLIETGAKETGVMMHLVTPELDRGPVVTYCTFPVRGNFFDKYWAEIKGATVAELKQQQGENNPLFKFIREQGLAREFPLIISTIQAFSEGKVRINDRKQPVDADGKPIKGYNLTAEIEKLIREAS
ncbi:MAG: formyltransferase family protein [Dehalococcoidales bacterium]|nr:formyltransferase family protein [Dehalococcoidales bacterium]